MIETDLTVARLAATNQGLATRDELLLAGLSPKMIHLRRRQGLLVAVHPGVYRHRSVPPTPANETLAAVLAAGSHAVASHRSAAWLHGLRGMPVGRPEITAGTSFHHELRGVRVHRTRQLEAYDRCTVSGIPSTTVARTLLDLGSILPFERVETAMQDAVITGKASQEQLVALLERVGRRGRPGTAILRAVVEQSLPDERLESELERRLLELIVRSGVPRPVLQEWMLLPDGDHIRVDFCWPAHRRVVEAAGRRWHAPRQAYERGLRRARGLRALGYEVVEFGWSDVVEHPASVIAELQAMNWFASAT